MIEGLISLLITLVIVGVIFWAASALIGLLPMQPNIKAAVVVLMQVICVLIILLAVLQVFGWYDAGLPLRPLHFRR